MTTSSRASTPEPASFRDPEARGVYLPSGEVLRELSAPGREGWGGLAGARLFRLGAARRGGGGAPGGAALLRAGAGGRPLRRDQGARAGTAAPRAAAVRLVP